MRWRAYGTFWHDATWRRRRWVLRRVRGSHPDAWFGWRPHMEGATVPEQYPLELKIVAIWLVEERGISGARG